MNKGEYDAGKCPLCLNKSMKLYIEKNLFRYYGRFKCNECGAETNRSRIPTSSIRNITNTNDVYIGMMLNHWNSLLQQDCRYRDETETKTIIKTNFWTDGYHEEHLKSCPLCRSKQVKILSGENTGNEYIICQQCGFHTKEYDITNNTIIDRTRMVNNWNNK